jgi:hypothetical protein
VGTSQQGISDLHLLRSYVQSGADSTDLNIPIWEACLATFAVSPIFNRVSTRHSDKHFGSGPHSWHNLSGYMLEEAKHIWTRADEMIKCMVSIGNGTPLIASDDRTPREISRAMVRIATEAQLVADEFLIDNPTLSQDDRYFRFNIPRDKEASGLNERIARSRLATATKTYLSQPSIARQLTICFSGFKIPATEVPLRQSPKVEGERANFLCGLGSRPKSNSMTAQTQSGLSPEEERWFHTKPELKYIGNETMAFISAAKKGYRGIMQMMMRNGANIIGKDTLGRTALHGAAANNHLETAIFLLNLGLPVNVIDHFSETPLMRAASQGGTSVGRLLLDRGADPTITDDYGWTPLSWAAMRGDEELVRLLLPEVGAPAPHKRHREGSMTWWSRQKGYINIANLIETCNIPGKRATAPTGSDELWSFDSVESLSIPVEINGKVVKALVCTGAQSSIISLACASDIGIDTLIDKRCAGVSRGIGTASILGRIHSVSMRVVSKDYYMAFSVMDSRVTAFEVFLGLDFFRRFKCRLEFGPSRLLITHGHPPSSASIVPMYSLKKAKQGDIPVGEGAGPAP